MKTTVIAALCAATLAAAPALASDFFDTRISLVFAKDNVFAKEGETTPNSPAPGFGAGNQNTQFFDNYNTKSSGFETQSKLVLYARSPAFFEGWSTEAAFAVQVLETPSGAISLRDDSSYVSVLFRPQSWTDKESVSLTGFPVTSDRFRLGYAWRVTWGGSTAFTNNAVADGVPGAKLQIKRERWYAFVGLKTALLLNNLILEKQRLYGYLAGAGIDITPILRWDVSGGYFQRGIVPGLAQQGIEAPVNAAGLSTELVLHKGEPVGQSVDLRLLRNDPDMPEKLFKPEVYPGGVSATVAVEASRLTQTLENPDVFAQTVPQYADALALQARLKIYYLRLWALGLYRSLSFIQFDVPGFPPYKTFPQGTVLKPELWGAVGVDYHLPRLHLTPGFIIGIQQPASFRSPKVNLGGNNPPGELLGDRTVVVRDVNMATILPNGYQALPILSAKFTSRWDISETVAGIGEVYYTRDANKVTFRDDQAGVSQPVFEREHALGFNLVMQARF